MGAKHHTPAYKAARAVLMRTITPDTRCWRCGHTLDMHPPHRNGRASWWETGHKPDGSLALEASVCNRHDGAKLGWQRRYGNPKPGEPGYRFEDEPQSPNA